MIADQATFGKTCWGEGEVKVYLDGDQEHPTLCGTGTGDYLTTGWGQGQFAQQWYGSPVADRERMEYSFYRLHGPDPVFFRQSIRVTIQQIGYADPPQMKEMLLSGSVEHAVTIGDGTQTLGRSNADALPATALFERQDDWSAVAGFYLNRPAIFLPAIAAYATRVAGLRGDPPPR